MKPDLIQHPCAICQQVSCGHTRADLRAHNIRCLELYHESRQAMSPAPRRKHHKVNPSGPNVFPAEEGQPFVLIPLNGKLIRMRTVETPAIKNLSDDAYCGGKDAA